MRFYSKKLKEYLGNPCFKSIIPITRVGNNAGKRILDKMKKKYRRPIFLAKTVDRYIYSDAKESRESEDSEDSKARKQRE